MTRFVAACASGKGTRERGRVERRKKRIDGSKGGGGEEKREGNLETERAEGRRRTREGKRRKHTLQGTRQPRVNDKPFYDALVLYVQTRPEGAPRTQPHKT